MNADRRAPLRLDQIQRWMQAVITHPDGVTAGLDSQKARGEIDVPARHVEEVVEPSQRRTSVERLEVYANAYYARLFECLRDEFPALTHALGPELFDGMAFEYLQTCPSTSYTLSELGRQFAQFLDETRPQDAADGNAPSWPEFLIDLARLERTYGEIFDGPGTEKTEPLQPEQIAAIPPEKWPEARLVPAPCLRLLSLRYPAHEYATAVRKKEDPPIPEPGPTWLAVSRIEYVVRRWPLSWIQFELLQSLLAGGTVRGAIESAAIAAAESGADADAFAPHLREWFEEWTASRFFQAIELPG